MKRKLFYTAGVLAALLALMVLAGCPTDTNKGGETPQGTTATIKLEQTTEEAANNKFRIILTGATWKWDSVYYRFPVNKSDFCSLFSFSRTGGSPDERFHSQQFLFSCTADAVLTIEVLPITHDTGLTSTTYNWKGSITLKDAAWWTQYGAEVLYMMTNEGKEVDGVYYGAVTVAAESASVSLDTTAK